MLSCIRNCCCRNRPSYDQESASESSPLQQSSPIQRATQQVAFPAIYSDEAESKQTKRNNSYVNKFILIDEHRATESDVYAGAYRRFDVLREAFPGKKIAVLHHPTVYKTPRPCQSVIDELLEENDIIVWKIMWLFSGINGATRMTYSTARVKGSTEELKTGYGERDPKYLIDKIKKSLESVKSKTD